MDSYTSKIAQEQIAGSIVNSVTGPSVNNSDSKNPVIPEIPSVASVVNKAERNGSNTNGGIWQIDYIMSEVLTLNKNVLRVLQSNVIEVGNLNVNEYRICVNSTSAVTIKVGNSTGTIWNSFNFNPSNYATTSELNNVYDQLGAKANTRLGNLVSDLTETEKTAIKNKLGITGNETLTVVDLLVTNGFQLAINSVMGVSIQHAKAYVRGKTLGVSVALVNTNSNSVIIFSNSDVINDLFYFPSSITSLINTQIKNLIPQFKLDNSDDSAGFNYKSFAALTGTAGVRHPYQLSLRGNFTTVLYGEFQCLN